MKAVNITGILKKRSIPWSDADGIESAKRYKTSNARPKEEIQCAEKHRPESIRNPFYGKGVKESSLAIDLV